MNTDPENNLDPEKLATEDEIRALLPAHLYTYIEGKLHVSALGTACLAIGVIEGKIPGDKEAAEELLTSTGYVWPALQKKRFIQALIDLGVSPHLARESADSLDPKQ